MGAMIKEPEGGRKRNGGDRGNGNREDGENGITTEKRRNGG
jgi:hypothetical protein